jgi:hypothetical protein
MNAMLEPRIVAAKIHGPLTAAGWEHRLLRIAASSQGGLAIVAIRPFSAGSLSVGSRRDGPEAFANVGFSLAAATPNPAARPQSSKIGGAQHHRYEFWVGSWGELVANNATEFGLRQSLSGE